ncbi:MAG: hypothetical protein GWM90_02310 [Gemmatimonadetes bacterium]|nr:hypothetical protein [Gemmatimonadota bacterium]NIQ52460.1 hypothetical protein [Gemmatimonadota bacterium]NIU72593.1 hypothetical protein [Gammaproteobacteria bacterium]NIX43002.1 hypothetical protein [Gemmatimonadota bacterium]NIY07177.1 hypothetical protein [Gemmatimonadota bacterium]
MQEYDRSKGDGPEFDSTEGIALALSYLDDPGDVACPRCGRGTIEVVAYLDATGIEEGLVRPSDPDGDYTVVLYCHGCKRAAALDLSPGAGAGGPGGGRRAA